MIDQQRLIEYAADYGVEVSRETAEKQKMFNRNVYCR